MKRDIQPVILTMPSRNCTDLQRQVAQQIANPIIHVGSGAGAAHDTLAAIRLAHVTSPESHVLLLEDDVLLCSAAGKVIQASLWPRPDVGVLCFCDMREVPEEAAYGMYIRSALGSDGRGWWGNQALLLHHDILLSVIHAPWFGPEIDESPGVRAHREAYLDGGRNCSDIRLGLVVHSFTPRPFYAVSVPSHVLHVGLQSECFPSRRNVAGIGERWTRNICIDLQERARILRDADCFVDKLTGSDD